MVCLLCLFALEVIAVIGLLYEIGYSFKKINIKQGFLEEVGPGPMDSFGLCVTLQRATLMKILKLLFYAELELFLGRILSLTCLP